MNVINRLTHFTMVAMSIALLAPVSNAAIIFMDDFHSDPAGQTGSGADLNPAIDTGGGDIGGTWSMLETSTTLGQVINDTTPGNGTLGSNNYMQVSRGGSSSSRALAFATGWTVGDTTDQLLQIDLDVYEPTATADSMGIYLGNAAKGPATVNGGSTSASVNSFVGAALAPVSVNTPIRSLWTHMTILANLSSTVTQAGLAPQQLEISYAGGAFGAPVAFQNPGNSVKTVMLGVTQVNNETNYFDNVVVQTVPEPATFTLLVLGVCAGLGARGTRRRAMPIEKSFPGN